MSPLFTRDDSPIKGWRLAAKVAGSDLPPQLGVPGTSSDPGLAVESDYLVYGFVLFHEGLFGKNLGKFSRGASLLVPERQIAVPVPLLLALHVLTEGVSGHVHAADVRRTSSQRTGWHRRRSFDDVFCAAYEGQVTALSLVRTSRPCRDDAIEAGGLRLRVRGDRFENSLPEETAAAGWCQSDDRHFVRHAVGRAWSRARMISGVAP